MKKKTKLAILDYGVGNLYSITRAVANFCDDFIITDDPEVVARVDRLILPGVGSFAAGMAGIRVRSLVDSIKQFVQTGRPILGICLGAQLLMTRGFEFGNFTGLDIIPGEVVKLSGVGKGVKIPHIGWGQIKPSSSGKKGVLAGVSSGAYVYFVHSFIMQPKRQEDALTTTIYGESRFCSAIRHENVCGLQFHPEKSGAVGMQIINNFIKQT
ncbi:MAG: imidazole glycerol phosphate synthase, glutamine amidotransferase subunit [Candidatus Yanofskybacteria bacterium RIFCSPLOWO2_02_FULL_45_10]|uniref:Imidazole glycerol phosphate synthase subunit HisH n=3 Tax=Patescibacteria group TaxID=1783273 RepID=A0A1F8G2Q2_9BACT|nr:MAG: imidazole glycerol phosphate synthase subunit HisH [Candidatus Daviesbacteria bacterium GW2011_GWB1_41_5]OGN19551.1 MAG: imidazole glycerol phosphate synthase, glutamine amidotransferase subunit [Candidatus Yanofskybacteria bacterium RIFCSPHIGHO2_12_FULL_45_19b]OGN32474.1 MAG: imidazole glycerol phosphate synthase, glutamine amidotransferase subunit [Candidatus Yanofskybacteria bacterium RIFCSPLOWO2_02_FULL_45_10]